MCCDIIIGKNIYNHNQRFDMNYKIIKSTGCTEYNAAADLYEISFPEHEQRLERSQREIMNSDEYKYTLIYDGENFIGEILCWETSDFIYVEHFCILPEKRGLKYGAKALEMLCRTPKKVILEIDPPTDDISKRRKAFYEQCGFKANGFEHIHPPYRPQNTGHKLIIMSYPAELSTGEFSEFSEYLNNTVMKNVF